MLKQRSDFLGQTHIKVLTQEIGSSKTTTLTLIKKEGISMIVYGTAFYPNLFQPNQMSNKFEMNIGQLDKDAIRDLTGAGLEVKTGEGKKEDHGDFITAKSGRRIRVVDAAGNPWDETRAIGNGSKVKASINPYNWTYKNKSGVGAGLNQVMVLEWVQYEGNEDLEPEPDYVKGSGDELD